MTVSPGVPRGAEGEPFWDAVPSPPSGLELSDAPRHEGVAVASLPSGRHFDLTPKAAALLRLVDGQRTIETIAILHAEKTDPRFTRNDLVAILEESFLPKGLVTFGGARVDGRRAPSRLWFRLPLLRPRVANALGGLFTFLFAKPVAVPLLAAALLVQAVFFLLLPESELGETWLRVEFWSWPIALLYLTSLWHELGHVAALRFFGERSGDVGVGMYKFLPAFFSDVSRSWRLARNQRLVVDLGGIYFQLLAASALAVGALLWQRPELSRAVFLADLGILLNLNPFLRLDGYWIAEDLSGTRDLRRRSKEAARALFAGEGGKHRPFVRIYAVLSLVYFAALVVWLLADVAPRTVGEIRDVLGDGPGWWGIASKILIGAGILAGVGLLVGSGLRVGAELLGIETATWTIGFRRAFWWIRDALELALWPWIARRFEKDHLRLLAVSLSTVYASSRSPASLREMARRSAAHFHVNTRAQDRLTRGDRAHVVQSDGVLSRLAEEKRGAVVCGFHMGPSRFAAIEVARRHPGAAILTAGHLARRRGQEWVEGTSALGLHLEVMAVDSPAGLVAARRVLRDGRCVVAFVDGTNRMGRTDRHTVDLTFLTLPVRVSTVPAELARIAGVPMVLAMTRRDRLARVVVTFSELLDVPEDPQERTREMYAWFERFLERAPEQWEGWTYHMFQWSRTGGSPTASRESWEEEARRIAALLANEGGRLVAEPVHVASYALGEERLLLHGPSRRVLKADEHSMALVEAACEGASLKGLAARTGVPEEKLPREVARLVLAGIVKVKGEGAARAV